MKEHKFEFSFEVYDSIDELNADDQELLSEARKITGKAYAPYSNFHVGAAAKLSNNKIVTGTNQENASYPVGICAERVLLSAISSLYEGIPVETMAVSYQSKKMKSVQNRNYVRAHWATLTPDIETFFKNVSFEQDPALMHYPPRLKTKKNQFFIFFRLKVLV